MAMQLRGAEHLVYGGQIGHAEQRHAHHELVYLLGGDYRGSCGGRRIALTPGGFLAIPAGTSHRTEAASAAAALLLVRWTGGEPLPAGAGEDRAGRLLVLLPWLAELVTAARWSEAQALWLATSGLVGDLLAGAAPATADPLARLHFFIADNCENAYRLERLAQLAGLSPSQLNRRFKLRYGHTPMAHLQQCRIDRALTLIRHGSLSMAEIARRCGWQDAAVLSHRLRAATGRSPRQWRQAVH